MIVELGFASRERVEAAVEHARSLGHTTGRTLVEDGVLTPDQLARALAARFGLEHLDLSAIEVDMGAANLLDSVAARRYNAVPVAFAGERTLLVAMADPANVICRRHRDHDGLRGPGRGGGARRRGGADRPAQPLRRRRGRAGGGARARARDGRAPRVLRRRAGGQARALDPRPGRRPRRLRRALRALRRRPAGALPQDGRVAVSLDGRELDIRVVTLPLVDGEAAVLRLLGRDGRAVKLEGIGLRAEEQERVHRVLRRTHGAVLVTGPTGAGKTTTVYAALNEINTREKTITTIEDPVEYQLDGIKQIQVNLRTGMTFAADLRSILRADPDVLMVDEIRDPETARTAIEAALTGHLVLSTLHTNDAASAIPRLLEMGTEPFLVASALECVIAQRLVRSLCDACKTPERVSAELLAEHGFGAHEDVDAFRPRGCGRCGGSGYRGRLGVFEVMTLDDELRELAVHRSAADAIDARARAAGMRSIAEDGLEKVSSGATSIAELTRAAVG